MSGPAFNSPPLPTADTCNALAAYMNSLPDPYTYVCSGSTSFSVKVCAFNTNTVQAVNSYCEAYSGTFPQV